MCLTVEWGKPSQGTKKPQRAEMQMVTDSLQKLNISTNRILKSQITNDGQTWW